MRTISKIGLLLAVILNMVTSQARTIFMSPEESELVLRSIEKRKAVHPSKHMKKLSGILYVDEDNWTVWIDGTPYSSIGQHEEFSIDEVTEDNVSLTMSDGSTTVLSVEAGVDGAAQAEGGAGTTGMQTTNPSSPPLP
ncbi:MAG: hypothetical protein LBJ69_01860 [Holosporales bacterium]|jgi:hypothetical protein|nr:hypothetical protein [Holosporales bacterium]